MRQPLKDRFRDYVGSTINSEFTYHGRSDERADIERDGLITLGDMGYVDDDGDDVVVTPPPSSLIIIITMIMKRSTETW